MILVRDKFEPPAVYTVGDMNTVHRRGFEMFAGFRGVNIG